ncbi:MAG: DUF4349 domain-containing protein [Alkalibacterium sp.]|nr:DUF4349 domain-containing protein [Alkalibacterium sp.]
MRRLATGLVLALFLAACASESDSGNGDMADSEVSDGASYMMDDQDTAEWEEEGMMEDRESPGERLIGEKVIRTASLEYETLDFERTNAHIRETVATHDAFIEFSYESTYTSSGGGASSRQYRMVDYTLRVPTERLNAFLSELDGLEAYKISEQMGTEDVTQFYRDTEARVTVLANKEDRLNELLEQAETIEEIIQIEDSLSDTIAERESLQSQLDYYDDLIDFTVVNLTVTERARIANERGEGVPFFTRVREAFVDSLFAFFYILQDLAIFLIYAIPFIFVIGLVAWLIWFVRKRMRRNNKKGND